VTQAVLLLAHGAPTRIEDVEAYLDNVRGGRPRNQAVVDEVTHRYRDIGGASHLLCWTAEQAEALERSLGIPVHYAMRNWHPFIKDVVPQIRADRVAAICLTPQFSELSVGLYMKRTVEAGPDLPLSWAKSYHDEPLLIEAFAERLRPQLPAQKVIFTAHSLPERALANGDPYERECRETAHLVATKCGVTSYAFAFQSQGMTGDKWLGPTVESILDQYAADGITDVVIHNIGFVCDHVEILWDIDIGFRDYAKSKGITIRRPESLNGSPTFIAALAEVAKRCLA
jgi:protoporphyrin/coproporphyrin ferrochelatase